MKIKYQFELIRQRGRPTMTLTAGVMGAW
jgi:hypothetical protein